MATLTNLDSGPADDQRPAETGLDDGDAVPNRDPEPLAFPITLSDLLAIAPKDDAGNPIPGELDRILKTAVEQLRLWEESQPGLSREPATSGMLDLYYEANEQEQLVHFALWPRTWDPIVGHLLETTYFQERIEIRHASALREAERCTTAAYLVRVIDDFVRAHKAFLEDARVTWERFDKDPSQRPSDLWYVPDNCWWEAVELLFAHADADGEGTKPHN